DRARPRRHRVHATRRRRRRVERPADGRSHGGQAGRGCRAGSQRRVPSGVRGGDGRRARRARAGARACIRARARARIRTPTPTRIRGGRPMTERELTEPVPLCLPNGSLNREAVGWSRRPLHDTSGIGRGIRDRGRNKRWEYWAVLTPTHIVSLTVSSLDFAGVHGFWVHDRRTGVTIDRGRVGGPWTA